MFTPGLSEMGGAARRSHLLASELAERGWDVRVVTRAGTLTGFRVTRERGLLVVEVPGFRSPRLGAALFLLVAVPLGLAWGLRSARAFVSIQITSQTTAAAICGLLLRRPYIALLTTGGSISELSYVLSRRSASIRRRLLDRAKALVAQTNHAADELRAAFSSPVEVVPNPVVGFAGGTLDGRPRALFSGRLSKEKDLPTLLQVWRRIRSEDDSACLTIVGSGGSYRSVEDQVRAQVRSDVVLSASVKLTGWVNDVHPYLADHDVYVFPSLSEGMSNSLLEACASGRVVVVSNIPSNLAVVGDEYPLTFAAGDGGEMYVALRAALYDDPARLDALNALEARMPMFSLDEFVDRIEALLR